MKHKKLIITLSIVGVVVLLLFSAIMVYFFGASYPEFEKLAVKEFAIPGLDTKFVPQGLGFDEINQDFLVSGYMSDGTASRIYVVDKSSGEVEKYVSLVYEDKDYTLHAGGVAVYGNFVWVAGDKQVEVLSLAEIMTADNGDEVKIRNSYITGNGADFVHIMDNKLVVGEFYKENKYETPASHTVNLSNGKQNKALAYVYNIDTGEQLGFDADVDYAISLPNQVQGMTISAENEIILSTSYSIPSSKIYVFENVLDVASEDTINIGNDIVPLYILDDEVLIKTINAPAMSEEMVTVEGKSYLLFESACSKYRLVNRTRTKFVYSFEDFGE